MYVHMELLEFAKFVSHIAEVLDVFCNSVKSFNLKFYIKIHIQYADYHK